MSIRKLIAGAVGFIAGILVIPIVIIASPFFCAWWLYNEEEE